jgi:homoserine kinase type II
MNIEQGSAISEISGVLSNYDLGELVSIERNDRGYVTTSYRIETKFEGEYAQYFFRQYKSGIQETEIQFEHSVINHLLEKKFALIAKVFKSKQGFTYIKEFIGTNEESPETIFYAVFDFLRGEDKYDCVDPHPSLREIRNSAIVQAEFHHAVADLIPQGQRYEPKILGLIPQIAPKIHQNLQTPKGTIFDAYLSENEKLIGEVCDEAGQYFAELDNSNWDEILIHCDFHPGNLKFFGEEVVGLFDFDWSKIDLRSFDVALAIWYFFADWRADQDGVLRIDEARIYLREYQSALNQLPDLDPISQIELSHFPMMVNLGNLFVLNWAVTDFYMNDVDPELYLKWLKHCVKFSQWFSRSGQRLIEKELTSI